MKKLKEILQESKYLKREFGEKLHTLGSVMKQHQDSKEPIKEAKLPQFGKLNDVSYYHRDWGNMFRDLANFRDYGPTESDMYDWNSRANYQAATKEYHAHMNLVANKLNSALKSMETSWKVWDKILQKHRNNDKG